MDWKGEAGARAAQLWSEQRGLLAHRTFLPPGPLHTAAEWRLFEVGNAIADLYPRRPAPPAASWAAD